VHKSDPNKNVEVGFETDPAGKVTWQGIPRVYMTLLQNFFSDKFMTRYPDVALRAILIEAQQ